MLKNERTIMNKFKNKDGQLSAYGLACHKLQRETKNGMMRELYMENGSYQVKKYNKDGERLCWVGFPYNKLTDARMFFWDDSLYIYSTVYRVNYKNYGFESYVHLVHDRTRDMFVLFDNEQLIDFWFESSWEESKYRVDSYVRDMGYAVTEREQLYELIN